ncbi:protein Flattop [Vidua macroura]|uniref:protein Flattop n=1 Tax=Vidua macroura TaxID=187451 RepID=UPI0023A7BDCD|nr:protein Flattop [Vidua macroura]
MTFLPRPPRGCPCRPPGGARAAVAGQRNMAGQYEDAFSPPRLRCWTVPRPPPKLPTPRPPTPFIANDRGHLLPHVRRSQVSPWGTFLGTWDMPARIPPARLDLSARQPRAAARLARERPPRLSTACNGLRTRVTGKLQKPWDTEPSGKEQGGPSGGPVAPNPGDNPEGGPCPQNPPGGGPCPQNPPEGGPCPQNPPGGGPCPQNPPCSGPPPSS